MSSIEVVQLTDAHASERRLCISRATGSNDNIVKWTPRKRLAANKSEAMIDLYDHVGANNNDRACQRN
jgi:hypothetical protein